jgi:2-(3-amino-3-carboxypropyl)histidine synthase
MEKKEKGALLRYLVSEKIGILITNKPGQMRVKKAIEFKKSLKDKRGYLFVDNNMDISQFENFGMDFWVNTACPRMDLTDGPLINLEKIPR